MLTVTLLSIACLTSSPGSTGDSSRVTTFELASRTFGNRRTIRVYLPPGYDDPVSASRRYPVLYLNDGFAVFAPRLWNTPHLLDSLIAAGSVAPFILVGIDNAASISGTTTPDRDRSNEYLPYPDSTEPDLPHPRGLEYPDLLVHEVMPSVERDFRVAPGAENTGVGGASYGGLAALVTVLRYPGRFGALFLESTPLFLFGERLLAESERLERWPGRVYVGIGTLELGDDKPIEIHGSTLERFVALVRRRGPGTRVRFEVVEGGHHNAASWRARLPVSLPFLFGLE